MAAWDDDGGAPAEYADVDDDYDPQSDNPLVQPGSDGLVTQGGPQMLMELARRREQGATLSQLRRDAGQIDPFRVTDRVLERAVDQGARLAAWEDTGRIPERLYKRYWRGIDRLPTRAELAASCGDSSSGHDNAGSDRVPSADGP